MRFEVSSITTYPIKGLAGQSHETIAVTTAGLLPGDRQYALSSGTAQSRDASQDSWLKKAHFLQTMSQEALAKIALYYNAADQHLRLTDTHTGALLFDGHLNRQDDSALLCQNIASFLGTLERIPRLFALQDGAGMTDTKTPYIAFGNRASIEDFAEKAAISDDERRYRLNVVMSGEAPFAEYELLGKMAQLGTAEFSFIEPVGRCAAIEVDPSTAERRKGLVSLMQDCYGATDMGVFATVTKAGEFRVGDKLVLG